MDDCSYHVRSSYSTNCRSYHWDDVGVVCVPGLSQCLSVSVTVPSLVSQSVSQSLCLSVCLSISLSISLSLNLSVYQSVSQYLCLLVCLSISLSISPSLNHSVCHLSSFHWSVHPSFLQAVFYVVACFVSCNMMSCL